MKEQIKGKLVSRKFIGAGGLTTYLVAQGEISAAVWLGATYIVVQGVVDAIEHIYKG